MKAISIRQPWIELILQGRKSLEIRSWQTRYRGPLKLHAAWNLDYPALKHYPVKDPVRRAIVGAIELRDVLTLDRDLWESLRPRHCVPGLWNPEAHRYAFCFESPHRTRPVPLLGKAFLFDVEEVR